MEQKFANLYGWTDVRPFEILKETAKTITIREMDAEELQWEKDVHIGGFSAHISNQRKQKWNITSNENNPVMKAYLRKDGTYHSKHGKHMLSDVPVKFYDYNF